MSAISIENRLAIHELVAEYSHRVDNYDGEGWSQMFTEEGRLVGMEPPLVGRQAFVDQSERLLAGPTEYRHIITNVMVLPGATNESASVKAYGTVADWALSPPAMAIFVEYRFDLVMQDGGWKIAEMEIHRPYEK